MNFEQERLFVIAAWGQFFSWITAYAHFGLWFLAWASLTLVLLYVARRDGGSSDRG